MNFDYLTKDSIRLLSDLNEAGIHPSPYNYVEGPSLKVDEYAIIDSTLREGEQTPGVNFRVEDKIRIAQRLSDVGVRAIEAGFPAASEKQMRCIRDIVDLDLDARVIAFSRTLHDDIDAVVESGADGIIICFSISQLHRESKFEGMTQDAYIERLKDAIGYAKREGLLVVYSGEDASRERDLGFLRRAYRAAEDAGADRARVIDTLGCLNPEGAAFLIREIRKEASIPLDVHFHNDLGLALANSLAAIEAGASAISTCVNGLGERAGITSTEEAIASLRILFGVEHYRLNLLTELSRLVSAITRIKTPCNKPITGDNVLTHSSGIHQHGVLKNPLTYEFYPPGLFGQGRRIELDELSGRHGVMYIAREELGIEISEKVAREVLSRMKDQYSQGERRASITPEELRTMIFNNQ